MSNYFRKTLFDQLVCEKSIKMISSIGIVFPVFWPVAIWTVDPPHQYFGEGEAAFILRKMNLIFQVVKCIDCHAKVFIFSEIRIIMLQNSLYNSIPIQF